MPTNIMQDLNAQAQRQLAAIMKASRDGVVGVTPQRVVVSWSWGAEKMYGYHASEMIGRSLDTLIPAQYLREFEQVMDKAMRGEAVESLETTHFTNEEKPFQVEISLAPVEDEASVISGALLIVRDISERKRAEQAVLEMEDRARHYAVVLETANRVALDILASRTGAEALRHIADAARLLAGARYAALGVAHPNSRPGALRLREFVTVGLTPEEEAAIGPRPKGLGVLGLLLERTEPLRIDCIAEHEASVGFPPNHPPMESFLGVPIRRGDVVLGSLYLTGKEGGASFTEADEVAVQALGAHAAVAIHHFYLLSRQRALVSGLMTALEEERRAVAYDLHDGLTQYVMTSHAHLEAFKHAHATGQEIKASRELEQGLKYLQEAVTESRRMVNNLRLLALEDLGLAGSLEQLLNQEKARAGWEDAAFIHNLSGRRFADTLETGVYRIAQESLTNARKHAESPRVQLLLLAETAMGGPGEQLRIEVRDWGRGFVPQDKWSEISGEAEHVGLDGIIERVHLLGGTYELRSVPGEGTTLSARVPVPEAQVEKPAAETEGEAP